MANKDRLATWLETSGNDELEAAFARMEYARPGLPRGGVIRVQTLINYTLRARQCRLDGRIEHALRLERKREALVFGGAK